MPWSDGRAHILTLNGVNAPMGQFVAVASEHVDAFILLQYAYMHTLQILPSCMYSVRKITDSLYQPILIDDALMMYCCMYV